MSSLKDGGGTSVLPPPIAPRLKKKSAEALDETAAAGTITPTTSSSPRQAPIPKPRPPLATRPAAAAAADPPHTAPEAETVRPQPPPKPAMQALNGGQVHAKAFASAINAEIALVRTAEKAGPGDSEQRGKAPRSPNSSPKANPSTVATLVTEKSAAPAPVSPSEEAEGGDDGSGAPSPDGDENVTEEERSRALTRFFSQRRQKSRDKVISERELVYKEDISEWFSKLFEVEMTPATLIEGISNGVLMCRLAKLVSENMTQWRYKTAVPLSEIKLPLFRGNAKVGSFLARDNISQFITWTKKIGTPCIFETNDLVEQTNIMQVLCCLMELARGAPYLNFLPQLVQFELEMESQEALGGAGTDEGVTIDIESLKINVEENSSDFLAIQEILTRVNSQEGEQDPSAASPTAVAPDLDIIQEECDEVRTPTEFTAQSFDFQLATGEGAEESKTEEDDANTTLPEVAVQDVVETPVKQRTAPPTPAPKIDLIPIGKNRYLLGNTKLHIRMFKNHLVVRVGGGWDTLENYLKKRAAAQQTFGETMDTEGADSPSKALTNAIKADKQVVKRGRSEVGIAQVKRGQVMESFNINVSWEKLVVPETVKHGGSAASSSASLFPRSGSSISAVSAASAASESAPSAPQVASDTQESDAAALCIVDDSSKGRRRRHGHEDSKPTKTPKMPPPAAENPSIENRGSAQKLSGGLAVETSDTSIVPHENCPDTSTQGLAEEAAVLGEDSDEELDGLTEAAAFSPSGAPAGGKRESSEKGVKKGAASVLSKALKVISRSDKAGKAEKPSRSGSASKTKPPRVVKEAAAKALPSSSASTPKSAPGPPKSASTAVTPSSGTPAARRSSSGAVSNKTPSSSAKSGASARAFVARPAPSAPGSVPRATATSAARATSASSSRTGSSAPSSAPSPARAKTAAASSRFAASELSPELNASSSQADRDPASSASSKRLSLAKASPAPSSKAPLSASAATKKRASSAGLAKK